MGIQENLAHEKKHLPSIENCYYFIFILKISEIWYLYTNNKNYYSQLSLRRTPSGPAPTVRLRPCPPYREFRCCKMTEKQCAGNNTRCPSYRGVRLIDRCPLRESWLYITLHRSVIINIILVIYVTWNKGKIYVILLNTQSRLLHF